MRHTKRTGNRRWRRKQEHTARKSDCPSPRKMRFLYRRVHFPGPFSGKNRSHSTVFVHPEASVFKRVFRFRPADFLRQPPARNRRTNLAYRFIKIIFDTNKRGIRRHRICHDRKRNDGHTKPNANPSYPARTGNGKRTKVPAFSGTRSGCRSETTNDRRHVPEHTLYADRPATFHGWWARHAGCVV